MNSAANNAGVPNNKRANVTDEHREEAAKLLALWHARSPRLTQAEFGEQFQLGNQANVGHYLHGRSALNARAAAAFARGLRVPVERFSKRLAAELEVPDIESPTHTPTETDDGSARQVVTALGKQRTPTAVMIDLGSILEPLGTMHRKIAGAILEELARRPEASFELARDFERLLGEIVATDGLLQRQREARR